MTKNFTKKITNVIIRFETCFPLLDHGKIPIFSIYQTLNA